MNKEIHIVSMIIFCMPEMKEKVITKANNLPHAECLIDENLNKFVLIFEANSEKEISSQMEKINFWHGVMSAQLCYHHCESEESLEEEMKHEFNAA